MPRREQVNLDLCGKRIGDYIVLDNFYIKRGANDKCVTYWKCQCVKCGNTTYIPRYQLKKESTNNCNMCKGISRRNEKLYHIFYGMIQRCENINNPNYKKYGARGIAICKEWRNSYAVFKDWALNNGYTDGLTIDRIDANKGYSPDNCRWITRSENSRRANLSKHKNKTKLKYAYALNKDGEVFNISNISDFCINHNLNRSTVSALLHGRLSSNKYKGWRFFSNRINDLEDVTTIENIIRQKQLDE